MSRLEQSPVSVPLARDHRYLNNTNRFLWTLTVTYIWSVHDAAGPSRAGSSCFIGLLVGVVLSRSLSGLWSSDVGGGGEGVIDWAWMVTVQGYVVFTTQSQSVAFYCRYGMTFNSLAFSSVVRNLMCHQALLHWGPVKSRA